MVRLTMGEKEMLSEDVLSLSQKLHGDFVVDLEATCNTLRELFQDVRLGNSECDKIQNLNKSVSELQRDTLTVCDEIKVMLRDAEIVSE